MTSEADIAMDRIRELCRTSASLTFGQSKEVGATCEAAKQVMKARALDLVSAAAGLPVLTSKSCDGTPLSVVHSTTRAMPGGKRLRRTGKAGVEFLVKNQFVRAQMPTWGLGDLCAAA